jgi:RNA polymerase sigma-70 factor (ECF subfamily)
LGTATNNDETWRAAAATAGAKDEGETGDFWDVATFEKSVARCEDRAYRLAVHLARSEAAAQEILQETFLSAWQNTSRFASRAQFSTWVYRKTVQRALGHLKRTGREEPSSDDDFLLSLSTIPRFWSRAKQAKESDWSILPARQLAADDLCHHIRETVNLLPTHLRAVFVLCDLEEISVEDSAEILDLPVVAVKGNLHAARMAIRHSIGLHFSRGANLCQGRAS